MGKWEDNLFAALNNYVSGREAYKNIPNVALGGLVASELERQAERKRLLDIQKQKDADEALERKYNLEKQKFTLDLMKQKEQERQDALRAEELLAPYKPNSGFDSETGERVTVERSPLSSLGDAMMSASGATDIIGDAVGKSLKNLSLYSEDPEKYKKMSDEEKSKAVDNVLAPYDFTSTFRYKPEDIYKKDLDYDRRENLKQMTNDQQTYNANVRLQQSREKNASNEKIANDKNATTIITTESKNTNKKDIAKEKNALTRELNEKKISQKQFNAVMTQYRYLREQISRENPNASSEEIDKITKGSFKKVLETGMKMRNYPLAQQKSAMQCADLICNMDNPTKSFGQIMSSYPEGKSEKSILQQEVKGGK